MSHAPVRLRFDGSASKVDGVWRGGWGFVVLSLAGTIHHTAKGRIDGTSQAAECEAALQGLRYCYNQGFHTVTLQGDSALVCKTLNGTFRISQVPGIASRLFQISQLIACQSIPTDEPTRRRLQLLPSEDGKITLTVGQIPRSSNKVADLLAAQGSQIHNVPSPKNERGDAGDARSKRRPHRSRASSPSSASRSGN